MNNTSCPRLSFNSLGFLPPVYILVFIVGMAANGWGLKFLLQNWKKMGNVNIFVLNLGLADFLYLLTLPFLVSYHLMKSRWIFGNVFCKITRFCFNLNLYGSIGFLTSISVYRYLAIVHSLRAMGRITVAHSVGTLTGFFIPFLITLGCYGHAILHLCRRKTTDEALKRRCLRLLCILILLFVVCYVPHHVFKNLNLWSRVLNKRKMCLGWFNGVYIAHQISRGLVCLNSALNPLVYFHADEDLPARLGSRLQGGRRMIRRRFGLFGLPVGQNTCQV